MIGQNLSRHEKSTGKDLDIRRPRWPGCLKIHTISRLVSALSNPIAIGYFVCPPRFYISIAFDFSWDDFKSREKLKTMFMRSFGGKQSVLWALRK